MLEQSRIDPFEASFERVDPARSEKQVVAATGELERQRAADAGARARDEHRLGHGATIPWCRAGVESGGRVA